MTKTDTLTFDSQQLAHELFALLRDLDASRMRRGAALEAASARARLAPIRERMADLMRRADGSPARPHAPELRALAAGLDAHQPDPTLPVERLREAWIDFRRAVQPHYEALATSLRRRRADVPTLRPTNYRRSLFHVLSGVACLVILQHLLPMNVILGVALSAALTCWTLEILRRRDGALNARLMRFFAPIAHAHEHVRVNSATWFATAMALIALPRAVLPASLGIVILAFADPAAGLVGRRFGRTPLGSGRSLEGTLTFAVVGAAAAFALLLLYAPAVTGAPRAALIAAALLPATAAELFSRRLDDNLTIPVAGTAGAVVVSALYGL